MMKRVSLIAAGWMFLVTGTAGLVLPVIPGIVFLVIGLSILSVEYEWARRLVGKIRRRFPDADRKIQGVLSKMA